MITKNHAAVLAVLLACGFSSAASADGLDYDFVDLNYFRVVSQSDPGIPTGHGLEVNGSYGLPLDFTVTGDAYRVTYDFGGPADSKDINDGEQVGLGYHYSLVSHLDLEAEVDYSKGRSYSEYPGYTSPSVDSHSLDYVIGLRYLATDKLELHGYLFTGRTDIQDSIVSLHADEHGYNLGLIYNFVSFFGLGLGYAHDTATQDFSFGRSISNTSHRTTLFARFQF